MLQVPVVLCAHHAVKSVNRMFMITQALRRTRDTNLGVKVRFLRAPYFGPGLVSKFYTKNLFMLKHFQRIGPQGKTIFSRRGASVFLFPQIFFYHLTVYTLSIFEMTI